MARTFDGYRLRPKARADLKAIWRYSARTWSPEQADRYTEQIIVAMEAAVAGTRLLRPIREMEGGYMKLLSGSHVIVAREEGGALIVVRILHQRQDPETGLQ